MAGARAAGTAAVAAWAVRAERVAPRARAVGGWVGWAAAKAALESRAAATVADVEVVARAVVKAVAVRVGGTVAVATVAVGKAAAKEVAARGAVVTAAVG